MRRHPSPVVALIAAAVAVAGAQAVQKAADDQKIYDFNYQATKESIQRALASKPTAAEVIAAAKTATHPYASGAEKKRA